MLRIYSVLLFFMLYSSYIFSQNGIESQFKSAEGYLESGFYELGRNLLLEIRKDLDPNSDEYRLCIDKISQTYSLQWEEAMASPSVSKRLEYLHAFQSLIEEEQKHLSKSIREVTTYEIYEALIGAHLSNQDAEKASLYRNKLYFAFKNGMLPEGMKEKYSLGKFSNGSVLIWGFEYFEGLPGKNDQGSFTKLIYSVYPANSPDRADKELMQFHLKKIKWIDNNLGEYILVQMPGSSQPGRVVTLWEFSYDEPLNYLELRETMLALSMSGDRRSSN